MYMKLYLVPREFLKMSVNSSQTQNDQNKKIYLKNNSLNYVCMNNKYMSKRNLKFFARFYFGLNIIFLLNKKDIFKGI